MREHIETLIAALSDALRPVDRVAVRVVSAEPRRRRPRVARSTYTPVRRDPAAPTRFAH
ncbi:hypothetical protein [Microbacterium cremeum]|uniref:hypothetical protein n=1 Tax=Microbacterium cremeum TaxID=2782169 RepID=UPI001888E48C|nr:hypothetical protein [Microbacterium cremeum]